MSNRLIEKYLEVVRMDGINTLKNVTIGTKGAGSTASLTVGTGGISSTGSITGSVLTPLVQSALVGATVVITAAQSGSIFQNRSTSGNPSWTLPAPANGLELTFTTANTTTGFTITSAAAVIHAKTSATGTAITSTTTITNTQATAVVGDSITIVCDGTAWWITAQTGIFAAS